MSASRRDKYCSYNTLNCLVQALEGKYTTVDLRNETSVYGKVTQVDGYMNIVMSHVIFVDGRGAEYSFDSFFVHARNIRYVHIPDEMSIIGTIKERLRKMKEFSTPKLRQTSKKAQQRHNETLQTIYAEKMESG